MNLSSLQDYVRRQTQTLPAELPNTTIDPYLQEAFNRTIAAENRWPFYETTWALTQGIGETTIDLPSNVNVPTIDSLYSQRGPAHALRMVDYTTALQTYGSSLLVDGASDSQPIEFSTWAGKIHLWPIATTTQAYNFSLVGYRNPSDWIAEGPSGEPDCDSRLHLPLVHYAIALAYAQQEDEQLESVYMQRWQRDVELARTAIMEAYRDQPLVMGPQWITPIGNQMARRGPRVVSIQPPAGS